MPSLVQGPNEIPLHFKSVCKWAGITYASDDVLPPKSNKHLRHYVFCCYAVFTVVVIGGARARMYPSPEKGITMWTIKWSF